LKVRLSVSALLRANEHSGLGVEASWLGAYSMTPLAAVTLLHGILIVKVLSDLIIAPSFWGF